MSDAPLELETTRCALCGADDTEQLFVATDRRYGMAGEFPVVRCRRCDLVYVNPRPSAASLGRFYPETYRPHTGAPQHTGRVGPAVRSLVFGRLGGAAGRAAGWLYNSLAYRAFLVNRAPGRVLDVGCGTGDYLSVWAELGWTVEGIEPGAAAASAARTRLGARIHEGLIEGVTLPVGAFDAITMSHSFEHVRMPREVLAIVHRALAPDGRLVLMLPNFQAWDRRAFGPQWYGLEVPRHLYHFTPTTLTALLEASGLVVEQLGGSAHADGVVRALGGARGRFVRSLATVAQLPLAAALRTTSMWAVARKH